MINFYLDVLVGWTPKLPPEVLAASQPVPTSVVATTSAAISTATVPPVTVIVPPATPGELSFKDFVAPICTFFGALAGATGAIWVGNRNVRAQDQRTAIEMRARRTDAAVERRAVRLDGLLDAADQAFDQIGRITQVPYTKWNEPGGRSERQALQLMSAQVQARAHRLAADELDTAVNEFLTASRQFMRATTREGALQQAQAASDAYAALHRTAANQRQRVLAAAHAVGAD